MTRLNKINNYILDKSIEIQIKLKYFCTSIIQQTLSMCLITKNTLKKQIYGKWEFYLKNTYICVIYDVLHILY